LSPSKYDRYTRGDPYQVFINNFKQWADHAEKLENDGGNFGMRLYSETEKSADEASSGYNGADSSLLSTGGDSSNDYTVSFKNLTENAFYFIKYQVISDVGASPWSDLRRVFVSQLPTKPTQVYGVKPGIDPTTISWSYDDTRIGNLKLKHFNVYVATVNQFERAQVVFKNEASTYRHVCHPDHAGFVQLYNEFGMVDYRGIELYFWVSGVSEVGEGPPSDVFQWSCANLPEPPSPPTLYFYTNP
jgi:hypothetical protein